jgi:hypothetical protein
MNIPSVTVSRPAGNTSNALECGFVEIGWVAEDFTENGAQQRYETTMLDIEKIPLQGFF